MDAIEIMDVEDSGHSNAGYPDGLLENIENLAKLSQNMNDVKEKNELSQKFIQSKDDHISLLMKHNQTLKDNFAQLEASYRQEIDSQNGLITTTQKENEDLRAANKLLETKVTESKANITNLSEELSRLQTQYKNLFDDREHCVNEFTTKEQSYVSEIEKLNDLLKRSKNEIVDQYIEKLYPHITSLCQMFDKNVSVSQLYSLYFEEKRMNEDMKIEKSVLSERVTILDAELDTTRATAQKYAEEIQALKKQEERIFQLESDNKEASVALRFYQESAQNLYKGSKAFNENFLALSEKIQHLAQQTNETNEDSSGMLALKYIMELQTKFQDFNKLQTEFEKGKLDLVSEKMNLIETDNEIESLRNQVGHLESEKRILSNQYEGLIKEFELLQSQLKNTKSTNESDIGRLQNVNTELKEKVNTLSAESNQLKADFRNLQQSFSRVEQERKDLEGKLQCSLKETDFAKQRLTTQKSFLTQMEKSLDLHRKQNSSLGEINDKLTAHLKQQQVKQSEMNSKVIELESQLAIYRLQVNILSEKEAALSKQLEANVLDSTLQGHLAALIESMKQSSTSIDSNLLKKIQTVETENANCLALLEQRERQWTDERGQLAERITELEAMFNDEAAKLNILNENYIKLQAIKSVPIDETAPIDEILKSENDLLKSQLENVNKQFAEASGQLSSVTKKYLDLSQENTRLLTAKGDLEAQLKTVTNEKATMAQQMSELQSELQLKVTELEGKLNATEEKYSVLMDANQAEVAEKDAACQLYLQQIEALNNSVAELNCQLERASIEVNSAQEQLQIYKDTNAQLQQKQEHEAAKQMEVTANAAELRRRIDQLQGRINEMESARMKQEEEFSAKWTGSQAEYRQLQDDFAQLNTLYGKISGLNRELCNEVAGIRQQMLDDPMFLSKREQLMELANLNGIIESLYMENRLLQSKCETFASKEGRLKSEVDSLRANQSMLEDCLKKETENIAALKSFYSDAENKEAIFAESARQLRAERDKLEREGSVMKQRIGQLEEQVRLVDVEKMNRVLDENKTQIDALKDHLNSRVNEINQMNQKLKSEEERNRKLEGEVREMTTKFEAQNGQLEALRRELASKGNINQKNQAEMNSLKSSLAVSDQAKLNLSQEIDKLRKEMTTLQNTNSQLKVLARKYKSQCDELQKQAATAANVTPNEAQPVKEDNSAEFVARIAEKDEKIGELETRIANTVADYENAKEEIQRLNATNEVLRAQSNDTDQRAKKIASTAQQRLNDYKRMVAELRNEIVALRTERQMDFDLHQPSTSKASTSNSNKMQISSTFISSRSSTAASAASSSSFESAINSNIQPSSSNEDVIVSLDSLQSAQITSHSTSDDNSSELFSSRVGQIADSNVSSNKRGYSSDSDPGLKKTRRDEQEAIVYEEEEEEEDNSNQSVVNIEEDSNDVCAAGSTSANYANVEAGNEESVGSADNGDQDAPMDSGNDEASADQEEDAPDAVQSFEPPNSASSSQLPSRPSSIDFLVPPTSSSSVAMDPILMQPGTSSSSSPHPIASTSIAFHPLTSHHVLSSRPNSSNELEASVVVQQRPVVHHHHHHHNAPRLIIPQNSNHLLSPQNPLMTPMVPFHDEGEGIVPSTPILYAPRFEENNIPPQVPQSRFLFSSAVSSGSSSASITPTISETVSSVISIDEAVGDFESNSPRPEASQVDEEQVSSLPTSSEATASTSGQQQNATSGTVSNRVRKLRIRSSRGGNN